MVPSVCGEPARQGSLNAEDVQAPQRSEVEGCCWELAERAVLLRGCKKCVDPERSKPVETYAG